MHFHFATIIYDHWKSIQLKPALVCGVLVSELLCALATGMLLPLMQIWFGACVPCSLHGPFQHILLSPAVPGSPEVGEEIKQWWTARNDLNQGLWWDWWDSVTHLETCWGNTELFYLLVSVWQRSLRGWTGCASSFQENYLDRGDNCTGLLLCDVFLVPFWIFGGDRRTNPRVSVCPAKGAPGAGRGGCSSSLK